MLQVYVDATDVMSSYGNALKEAPSEAKKAFQRMLKDTERHAQMVVAKQVSAVYTISSAGVKKPGRSEVSTRVDGASVSLVYRGRTLTWSAFKYAPRTRPKKPRAMRVAIKKAGGMKSAGPRVFVGGTGAMSAAKIQSIPFMRTTKKRKPIMPAYSLSVPQMVLNENEVVPPVLEDLGPYMQKRFEHHFAWFKKG